MKWYRAEDTFSRTRDDGTVVHVNKGQTLPESHECVRLDLDSDAPGRVRLFSLADAGEPETPKPKGRAAAKGA